MSEIIFIYNTTLHETSLVFDPTKNCDKQMRIEPGMLNFCPGPGRHASSPCEIGWIDWIFLFVLEPCYVCHCNNLFIYFWKLIPYLSKGEGAGFGIAGAAPTSCKWQNHTLMASETHQQKCVLTERSVIREAVVKSFSVETFLEWKGWARK